MCLPGYFVPSVISPEVIRQSEAAVPTSTKNSGDGYAHIIFEMRQRGADFVSDCTMRSIGKSYVNKALLDAAADLVLLLTMKP